MIGSCTVEYVLPERMGLSGLADVAILQFNHAGYEVAGVPPILRNEIKKEGFIVNPLDLGRPTRVVG